MVRSSQISRSHPRLAMRPTEGNRSIVVAGRRPQRRCCHQSSVQQSDLSLHLQRSAPVEPERTSAWQLILVVSRPPQTARCRRNVGAGQPPGFGAWGSKGRLTERVRRVVAAPPTKTALPIHLQRPVPIEPERKSLYSSWPASLPSLPRARTSVPTVKGCR